MDYDDYDCDEFDTKYRGMGYTGGLIEAARELVDRQVPASTEETREQLAEALARKVRATGASLGWCWNKIH